MFALSDDLGKMTSSGQKGHNQYVISANFPKWLVC